MNRNTWIVLGAVLSALVVVAAVGASAAYADDATPPAPPDERGGPPAGAMGERPAGPRGPRPLGPAELEAAAQALGMTTEELQAELQSGTRLVDIASEKGVDIDDVRAAIQAAHKATMLENIQQAVADGNMTQENADWLILGLEKGYMGGPGFGFGRGMGPGGPMGPRGSLPEGTAQPPN